MIPWLDPEQPPCFPDTRQALDNPDGLLAAGGKLSSDWLLSAYQQGIFPWFGTNSPILWWSPALRTVLLPDKFHTSRSLARLARQNRYHITCNQDFQQVIQHCAMPRRQQQETWITADMIKAYTAMHEIGIGQSFECRDQQERLVGGIYGLVIGRIFFGESMFSLHPNTSKLCLKHIMECGSFDLLDCQLATRHLMSLGAIEISRETFEQWLAEANQ